ncbi:hypothetical protein M0804_004087 [Polistes exclamans]|nr:hypothetical protein M0804_004087 [Polistes exclamans]
MGIPFGRKYSDIRQFGERNQCRDITEAIILIDVRDRGDEGLRGASYPPIAKPINELEPVRKCSRGTIRSDDPYRNIPASNRFSTGTGTGMGMGTSTGTGKPDGSVWFTKSLPNAPTNGFRSCGTSSGGGGSGDGGGDGGWSLLNRRFTDHLSLLTNTRPLKKRDQIFYRIYFNDEMVISYFHNDRSLACPVFMVHLETRGENREHGIGFSLLFGIAFRATLTSRMKGCRGALVVLVDGGGDGGDGGAGAVACCWWWREPAAVDAARREGNYYW